MTLCRSLRFTFALLAMIGCTCAAQAAILDGIAVVGDGGESSTVLGSPPLAMHDLRGLNFGPNMAYDYATLGAYASSQAQVQAAQVITQVQNHNVTLALMNMGENDLLSVRGSIANGSIDPGTLASEEDLLAAYIEGSVSAILAAGGKVVLGGLSDQADSPGAVSNPADKARLEAKAIAAFSSPRLAAFAASNGVPFINFYALEKSVFDSNSFVVGGVPISLTVGTDPHNFFYDPLHAGIVINGEIANLWIQAMNEGYGTNISLLSDLEILQRAGLASEYLPPTTFSTATNLSQFVSVPEPSAVALLVIGGAALVIGRGVRRSRCHAA